MNCNIAIIIPAMNQVAQRLLGSLTPSAFLRRHWQKRPLFVRGAIPDCDAWLQPATLFELAARDDVESRLVIQTRSRWTVQHGPFSLTRAKLRDLPERGWTLLVQGVDQHLPEAAALLQRFSFIPHARLDDLMVSYAPPGGGVGSHFDSYDVFLLQGAGSRRWRISAQKNFELVENAPLRILKNFEHTQEWIAERGDLLYLPPRYAHEGVAVDNCMTLSVGFRAPRHQELATKFLEYLQDELQLPDLYQDRDLLLQKNPGQLSQSMLDKISAVLKKIRWDERDIRHFAGRYLSEPKVQTVFRPPRRPATRSAFARKVALTGMRLALPTRMLFHQRDIFINGELHALETHAARDRAAVVDLANHRAAPAFAPTTKTLRLLYAWYCAGYIEI